MRLKSWILVSLTSLLFVGYAENIIRTQAVGSSVPEVTQPSQRSLEASAIAQTMMSTTKTVKSGNFVSGEHPTQGKVRIVTQSGKTFLELDQGFKTSSMGPDLVVILHRSSNVLGSTKPPAYPLKQGDYVFLAPLQKFNGAQRYAIPANVNVANYKSAAIWCRKFNATFGAAKLN